MYFTVYPCGEYQFANYIVPNSNLLAELSKWQLRQNVAKSIGANTNINYFTKNTTIWN